MVIFEESEEDCVAVVDLLEIPTSAMGTFRTGRGDPREAVA